MMKKLTPSKTVILALVLLVFQVVALFILGQPWICECGYIKLWEGVVNSIGNSQHLSDWYTFSHIIHGVIFYYILGLLFPRMSVALRLLIAMGIEIGWEISENTPWVINKYREQALAQGYVGDSILNSVSDTVAMIVGFLLSYKLPTWVSVLLVIVFELFVGYLIHDGLMLNILNFVYPMDAVTLWQNQTL